MSSMYESDEHPIFKAKVNALETKTYPDNSMEMTTSATLNNDQLDKIRATKGGKVYTWAEMIDNSADVSDFLKASIGTSHHLGDYRKMPLNFLLSDVKVHNIQTTDPNGFFNLAGTLAWPKIKGMTYSTQVHNGKYQKAYPVDRPLAFDHDGQIVCFNHVTKPHNSGAEYVLVSHNSQMLPSVKYPNGEIHGASPFVVDLVPREDGSTKVVPRGAGLLHGHMINNDTIYGDVTARPKWSSFLRPNGDGVVSEEHVQIPPNIYQEHWWKKSTQYHTDKGPMVPHGEYVQGTYDFLDQILNGSRCTNFDHSGIWWNAQYIRDIPCVKMHITFRIVPIVDYHSDGAQNIPYQNLLKASKNEIEEAD